MDDTGPIGYLVVGTHNDVCVAGIDVLYQGNKAGDGFFQHMGQFLEMGYTVRIGDKDSHDLSGLDADAAMIWRTMPVRASSFNAGIW